MTQQGHAVNDGFKFLDEWSMFNSIPRLLFDCIDYLRHKWFAAFHRCIGYVDSIKVCILQLKSIEVQ